MAIALKNFWRNEDGATSVEYALIAVVVSVGILGSIQEVKTGILRLLGLVEDGFDR